MTDHYCCKIKSAFTLAEVLITLGIIGIVAAMTLPSVIAKFEKQRNINVLKRAYSDLHKYLNMFDYDYDCAKKLSNCAYTPPTGSPQFIILFSQYLVEKQKFSLPTGRFALKASGEVYPDLPYFASFKLDDPNKQHFLISPTGTYAYYITNTVHDNFYKAPNNRGMYRAKIFIFTDSKHFSKCKLNCTTAEMNAGSKLGKNIFKLFITDNEYIMPQGDCKQGDYHCTPLNDTNCSKNSGETCLQKIIQDGWQIKYY